MAHPPSIEAGGSRQDHVPHTSSQVLHSLLIVEDDESHIELIQRAFDAQPECVNLTFARTLKEAKEMILAHPPDMIIADWLLPDGKGGELIPHTSGPRSIPVLMMTSHGNEDLAVEMMKAGAIDYIVKSDVTLITMPHIVRNAWLEYNSEITRKRMAAALDESELKYREIFNNVNDAIHIHKLSESGEFGKFIEVNDVACQMLNYTPQEFHSLSPPDIATDYHSRPVREIVQEIISQGHSTFETEHRSKDGMTIPVEVNAHRFLLRGNPVVLAVVRDIRERKRGEDELRQSAEKYRTLIESANEGIIVIQDGKIPFANPKALEIVGYSSEYLGEKNFVELVHPDDRDETLKRHLKRIEYESIESIAMLRVIDKEGALHWLEVNAVLIQWNKRPATLNFITDITKRKNAEEGLRESEEKYRGVIEHIQDVFYRTDTSGTIIMASPSIARVFRYDSVDECLNKPFTMLFRDPKQSEGFLAEIGKEGFVDNYPVELKKKDATPLMISASSHYYYDNSGNILGVEGILRDITDQTETEAALRDSLAEKEVLLKEIHHRVKNNLQIVSGLLYLESRRSEDNATKTILESCRDRISSMALLHESLYQVTSSLASVKVFDYVNTLVQYLNESYNSTKNIGILVTIPKDTIVDIDTGNALGLIITELLTNILKYAFPDGSPGTVTISMEQSGQNLVLLIKDNGIGLPKGFDFEKSTNLGMKLVTNLVRQIKGTLQVDGTVGTTITISFPSVMRRNG